MTTNRLAQSDAPQSLKMPSQAWVDRGNALLAGVMQTTKNEYLTPRNDVHWFLENGRAQIGWRIR